MSGDTAAKVHDILSNLRSLERARELFAELNYDPAHDLLSRGDWSRTAADALAEDPQIIARHDDFKVIYARLNSDQLLLGDERPVVNCLLQEHPYFLCLFSDSEQQQWHFVNIKYDEDVKRRRLFRRITVGPDERLRTATERLTILDLETISADLFGLSPLAIQARHDEAFDVEKVTRQFFDEYGAVFQILEDDLRRQTKDSSWAHDYALQFLNRCMFIYFLQRKGWLGDNREFLLSFWEAYRTSGQNNDSFVNKWLKVLFFEAFNNKFHGGYTQFPEEIKRAMSLAPFLNGGLFTENDLDLDHSVTISDKRFEQVFKFLQRYNFTIAEDSPLDKEVAVDPEMIGKVYESLVNVSEDVDKRGEAGIFYTPRTEIDLMCRLSLVDHLANHLGGEWKDLLYQLVFALEPDEKVDADKAVAEAALWSEISERLREITVLDPACGSGSFLVGMLHIFNDLEERANQQLGLQEDSYERKKRIIGQSLYGVDVMDWACHIAELRLWLALIIDAELSAEELHVRPGPLLPHFSFKIRCGDSLVQEVGGINLGRIRDSRDIPVPLKARITRLKTEKLKFYDNDETRQLRSPDQVKQEERQLFTDILDTKQHEIQEHIKSLRRKIEGPQERRIRLDGTIEEHSHQIDLEARQYQQQIETLQVELEQIKKSSTALKTATEVPFVWDIAFVEIFGSEKDGFDIVVGNPPYVRQEAIADPQIPREKVTAENKRVYKDKLARSVYQTFPRFFGYKASNNTVAHKLNAKSDLYIYFYLHGLSLLNTKGAFCFITSNSWLDVGYGADLQEFLLKHCHVKMILDNQAKRTFATADVNTVIVLFSAPDDHHEWALEKTARFVMFKVPFEHIISPVIFDEIEEASERRTTPEYRAFPIQQSLLLKDGCELKEDDEKQAETTAVPLIKFERYIGNKWGGKYLRAPDIYWTILEKGACFTQSLSEFFNGERYLNTGGADGFFIITDAVPDSKGCFKIYNGNTSSTANLPFRGEIEQEYLLPLVKDYTKTDKRIEISGYDAYCLVIQGEPSSRAKEYIRWGEKQCYHKRSVTKSQYPWYRPTRQMLASAKIIIPRSFNDTFIIHYNPKDYLSLRFYRLHPKQESEIALIAYLNTTLVALIIETLGNRSLGQGVLDFFMADFLALRIPVVVNRDLEEAFYLIKDSPVLPVKEEYGLRVDGDGEAHIQPRTARKQLDSIVFDALGLTQGERDAAYEAIINLVEARLKKAGSVWSEAQRRARQRQSLEIRN